jgi:hypothetical protein
MLVQDQILLGTILGGSSLLKPPKGINYYLSMRSRNQKWLEYKIQEMESLFEIGPRWRNNTFRCNSRCDSVLTELHQNMYIENKRMVTMEIIDPIRDIGLAVWYLDGGGKTGRNKKNAYINTTKFGEDGTAVVKQYFDEVDMPCNVNRQGERLRVLFTVNGTEELFKTIEPCVPLFMIDRI